MSSPVAAGAPPGADADDFLSGRSGHVAGIRANVRAALADVALDAVAAARGLPWRLRRAARALPPRRVLAVGVVREDRPNAMAHAVAELRRSRHDVTVATRAASTYGKWENVRALLEEHPAAGHDWLLVVDDDVGLPRGFLDVLLFCAERFDLLLAQPAHRRRSHAAWPVTRRVAGSVARETGFVEIGPVVALHASTFDTLLPFPPLRAGWGLDVHWAAIAAQRGWRIGVVDAVPVRHAMRAVAAGYASEDAVREARTFLAGRPYVPRERADRTLAVHRRW